MLCQHPRGALQQWVRRMVVASQAQRMTDPETIMELVTAPGNQATECEQQLVFGATVYRCVPHDSHLNPWPGMWKCELIWKQGCRTMCSMAVTKHPAWVPHTNEGPL